MNQKIRSTDRLKLRPIALSDLEVIHNLHSLPETDQFNTLGIPKNIQETKAIISVWIEDNQTKPVAQHTFVIESKLKSTFIGLIALRLGSKKYNRGEVWFKLMQNQWNQGYATEALNELINFGFTELKLHRIEAGCAVKNIASKKVLEKSGFIKEGVSRSVLPLKSGWSDTYEFSLLETDNRVSN